MARVVGMAQEFRPAALWARFLRWVRVQQLRMDLAGLEEDLAHVEQMKGFEASLEARIRAEIKSVKEVLHIITRKGGV